MTEAIGIPGETLCPRAMGRSHFKNEYKLPSCKRVTVYLSNVTPLIFIQC